MKKVLVFRHVPHEGLGTMEPFLRRFQVLIDYRNLFRNSSIPETPDEAELADQMYEQLFWPFAIVGTNR